MASRPVYLRKHVLRRLQQAEDTLKMGHSVIINEILEENLENYVKKRLSTKEGK